MTDEKELILASLSGDTEAFSTLVSLYEKKVYNIALRMVGNLDDALDISQEVFLRVFKNLKSFEGNSSFSTWIYRITTNLCLDFLRTKKRKISAFSIEAPINLNDDELVSQIPDNEFDTYKKVEENFIKDEIISLLESLPPDYKAAVILRDINGLSYTEISETVGCSLPAVKSRIRRGRDMLKKAILKKRKHFNDTFV